MILTVLCYPVILSFLSTTILFCFISLGFFYFYFITFPLIVSLSKTFSFLFPSVIFLKSSIVALFKIIEPANKVLREIFSIRFSSLWFSHQEICLAGSMILKRATMEHFKKIPEGKIKENILESETIKGKVIK